MFGTPKYTNCGHSDSGTTRASPAAAILIVATAIEAATAASNNCDLIVVASLMKDRRSNSRRSDRRCFRRWTQGRSSATDRPHPSDKSSQPSPSSPDVPSYSRGVGHSGGKQKGRWKDIGKLLAGVPYGCPPSGCLRQLSDHLPLHTLHRAAVAHKPRHLERMPWPTLRSALMVSSTFLPNV
jgi:hypothetical protein